MLSFFKRIGFSKGNNNRVGTGENLLANGPKFGQQNGQTLPPGGEEKPFDPRVKYTGLGFKFLAASDFPTRPYITKKLSFKFMKQHKIFPLGLKDGILTVAMGDPTDVYTIDAVKIATGFDIEICAALEQDINDAVERHYGFGAATMEEIIEDIAEENIGGIEELDENIDHLRDMAYEAPVIRLVNLIMSRAVEARASDIHIEPFEKGLVVRYRIDGILHDVESPPRRLQWAIISRIKIMAKMNIAERRLPQDGRIKIKVAGKEIDIRVSTVPTLYGESLVMRILDRSSIILSLDKLGFPEDTLKSYEQLISKPYGIILVTGPTGSGKTTTLYAALEKINTPDKKIITVEDPIEYQLDGVNQIQVKPQIGLTFANGLRSIVRQDPDVIMIGEIRDSETAEIAIESALTGHLVFSTLHTNDAAGAITRLLDMGVEHYLVASAVEGIMAQRLVRVLCPNCKEIYSPSRDVLLEMGMKVCDGEKLSMARPVGCAECNNTGYLGRTGIFELFILNDEIRNLILQKTSTQMIKQKGVAMGMRLLREDGWVKVKKGITSIAEVLRVTQED